LLTAPGSNNIEGCPSGGLRSHSGANKIDHRSTAAWGAEFQHHPDRQRWGERYQQPSSPGNLQCRQRKESLRRKRSIRRSARCIRVIGAYKRRHPRYVVDDQRQVLMKLANGDLPLQSVLNQSAYGLIAEEGEKVYPELVIEDANARPRWLTYKCCRR